MPSTLNLKNKDSFILNLDRFTLDLTRKTYIMGILNRTPDSFYDGGKFFKEKDAVAHIYKMIEDGADMIDIGGRSTRPGSDPISEDEELRRVIPVIKMIANKISVPVSVDTYNHTVAEEAVKNGASIVNDITGLKGDCEMADVIARYNAGVILMHIKGTPKNMQNNPYYENLIDEIIEYLSASIEIAKRAGISSDKIIIDPGIGFGKTAEHNLTIINRLADFNILDKPILIGVSRKSFIGHVLNQDVNDRFLGTIAACVMAIKNGANIIRVHDVGEMKEITKMADAIIHEGNI